MAKLFPFYVVTPDGKSLKGECDLLTVVTTVGILGIMAGHTPLEAVLDIGEMIVHNNKIEEHYALGGGILHITKEGVTILADSFEASKDIDLLRAQKSKDRAEERLKDKKNIDVLRAEISLKKALLRIKVASK